MLGRILTYFGLFSAASGGVMKRWLNSEANVTGIRTFSIEAQDIIKEYGFFNSPERVVENEYIQLLKLQGDEEVYNEFYLDDTLEAEYFFKEKFKSDETAVAKTLIRLQQGFFLKMPLEQSLGFKDTPNSPEKMKIKCPTEDHKLVLIKYAETEKKLTFYAANYKAKQIRLKELYSLPNANVAYVANIIRDLANTEGLEDIPLTFDLIDPKSGKTEEIQTTTAVIKEYRDGKNRYSLHDLKSLASSEEQKVIVSDLNRLIKRLGSELQYVLDDLKSLTSSQGQKVIVSELNRLIKCLGSELQREIATTVINQIKTNAVKIAKARTVGELNDIAENIEKIPQSKSFIELETNLIGSDLLIRTKKVLLAIVEKLKSLKLEQQSMPGPKSR